MNIRKTMIRKFADKKFKAVVCIISLILLAGCSKNEKDNQKTLDDSIVKIGVIMDFSGENSENAEQMYNAVSMAVDEINADGGVLTDGKKLELVKKDDGGVPLNGAAAYYQLVEEGAAAVIGSDSEAVMDTLLGITYQSNVPLITPCVTDDKVASALDFNMQSCYSDSYMAEGIASFTADILNVDKVAVVYDKDSDFGIKCYEKFMEAALKQKLRIVCVEDSLEFDFMSIVEAGAQAIYVPSNSQKFTNMLFEMAKDAGYKGCFLGDDKMSERLADTLGYKIYMPSEMAVDDERDEVQSFIDDFTHRYNINAEDICSGVMPSYESVYYIRDAIEKGYQATAVSIMMKMAFLEGSTPMGDYQIGAYGDVRRPMDFICVEQINGKLVSKYVDTIFE